MKRTILMVLVFGFIFTLAAFAADDPQLGVWKLDLEKSKVIPGPMPQSRTVTIVADGENGVKLNTDEITASGKHRTVEFRSQYDGKQYPRVESGQGGVATGTTVSLRRIDAWTVERTLYLDGQKVLTETWKISRDGKTRTVVQKGKNERGQTVDELAIFEKQ
ncbi:MAG: hypothetical protein WCC21_09035 [Candidatus Acidiferrales bacterium]